MVGLSESLIGGGVCSRSPVSRLAAAGATLSGPRGFPGFLPSSAIPTPTRQARTSPLRQEEGPGLKPETVEAKYIPLERPARVRRQVRMRGVCVAGWADATDLTVPLPCSKPARFHVEFVTKVCPTASLIYVLGLERCYLKVIENCAEGRQGRSIAGFMPSQNARHGPWNTAGSPSAVRYKVD